MEEINLSGEKFHTKTYGWVWPEGPGESGENLELDMETIGEPLQTLQFMQHVGIQSLHESSPEQRKALQE